MRASVGCFHFNPFSYHVKLLKVEAEKSMFSRHTHTWHGAHYLQTPVFRSRKRSETSSLFSRNRVQYSNSEPKLSQISSFCSYLLRNYVFYRNSSNLIFGFFSTGRAGKCIAVLCMRQYCAYIATPVKYFHPTSGSSRIQPSITRMRSEMTSLSFLVLKLYNYVIKLKRGEQTCIRIWHVFIPMIFDLQV